MKRPNILYIHSHDTGRYIQPYGHAIPTPAMQRLAEEGVLFRQAFCAGPTCSASRAGLVTGQSPHSCGMLGLAHRGFGLNDYSHHIVHTMKQAGYTTALAGFQHVAPDPAMIGYDEVIQGKGHAVRVTAPNAAAYLDRTGDRPFFLSVGFSETHRVFRAPEAEDDPRYMAVPPVLPDTEATRSDMAAFRSSAREYDRGVGIVLEALERNGLAENTLVINTTDHGIAFPDMKCNLTNHGIGVMLIMRGPGGFRGGRVIDSLVSHIDIFPTLCELLGIDPPERLEGRSFMPLIREERDEVNEAIYSEVTFHAAYEPMRAVRTRRWNYIRRFDGRETPVLPNCDDSPSKDTWLDAGYAHRPVAAEQLYDLVFDPQERCNLAGRPDLAGTLTEMQKRLGDWMKRTNDPLLSGKVPAPAGARVNNPDGLSPKEATEKA